MSDKKKNSPVASGVSPYKLCMVGAENSGKTALLLRFLNDSFINEDDPTIEDSHTVTLEIETRNFPLEILDTGGSSAYEHLHDKWYTWADGFVIVFNMTQKYTFDLIPKFLREINDKRKENPFTAVLVASHADKEAKRAVTTEEALELAYEHKLIYFEASAQSGNNVKRVFKDLVKEIRNLKKEALLLSGYESVSGKKRDKKDKKKQEDVENALSIVKDPKKRQELVAVVPKGLKVVNMKKKTEMIVIKGPPDDESEQAYRDIVSAKTISTYPRKNLETKEREGDPICDQYFITTYENRTIFAIADGCNWGEEPRDAARKSCRVFMEYMKKNQKDVSTLEDIPPLMLRAYLNAHNSIIEGRNEETIFQAGTTTMLAGILLEVEDPSTKWAIVAISLGDCKGYVWKHQTGDIVEWTEGNRQNITDARDPGGRLGPYLQGGAPDLRNLTIFYSPVSKGDIVFLVSDGVYDNLDPQHLGKTPKELAINLKDDDWGELDKVKNTPLYDEAEKIKNLFSMKFLTAMVGGPKSINQQTKTTCSLIVNKLTNNCQQMTQAARDFMENNPQKKLPKDYKLYPGKMDHSTVVAFKVGDESHSARPSPPTPKNPTLNPDSGKGPWQEYLSDTGEKYFFNVETGESSWEDPTTSNSDWKKYYDDSGDPYWHNVKTGESVWQDPTTTEK